MTINDIRDANESAGLHFFEPAAMRFFDSKVLPKVYEGPGGVYFVTSEQFHDGEYHAERKYTVREFNPENGRIWSNSEFNKVGKAEAQAGARKLAKN